MRKSKKKTLNETKKSHGEKSFEKEKREKERKEEEGGKRGWISFFMASSPTKSYFQSRSEEEKSMNFNQLKIAMSAVSPSFLQKTCEAVSISKKWFDKTATHKCWTYGNNAALLTAKEELTICGQGKKDACVSGCSFVFVHGDAQVIVSGGQLHRMPLTVIQTWAWKSTQAELAELTF